MASKLPPEEAITRRREKQKAATQRRTAAMTPEQLEAKRAKDRVRFKAWYEAHPEKQKERQAKRNEKYSTDPAVKARKIAQVQASKRKRNAEP